MYLNSTGRIGRLAFVAAGLPLVVAWLAFDFMRPTETPALIVWLFAAATLYAGSCVLSQRLHDRGRSGWWSGPILLLVVATLPVPSAPSDWIAAALLGVVLVDLTLFPGQPRFNRYGAAPDGQASGAPG